MNRGISTRSLVPFPAIEEFEDEIEGSLAPVILM
jgi:hypothetical protein